MALFKPDAPEYPELSAAELGQQVQTIMDIMTNPGNIQKSLQAEQMTRPEYLKLSLADMWGTTMGYGGQQGTLSLLEQITPRVSGIQSQALSAQRAADIGDIEALGGRATAALRASDPQRQRLIEQQQAMTDRLYGMAERVTPEQQRGAQQAAREASMARGRGYDASGIAGELLGRESVLSKKRTEAQQSGAQLFGMLQATTADPFQAILGRPGMAYGGASQQQGFGAAAAQTGVGPAMFDPNSAFNVAMMERANQANYNANIYGSQAGATGAIFGGLLGGAGSALGGYFGREK